LTPKYIFYLGLVVPKIQLTSSRSRTHIVQHVVPQRNHVPENGSTQGTVDGTTWKNNKTCKTSLLCMTSSKG